MEVRTLERCMTRERADHAWYFLLQTAMDFRQGHVRRSTLHSLGISAVRMTRQVV